MNTLEERIDQIDQLEVQREFLQLINDYSAADRKTIKQNLKRILTELNIKPKQIIELGFSSPNVYSWLANVNNNIPLFPQALTIAVEFDFDVKEFLQEIEIN